MLERSPILSSFDRILDYVRISVTDRCNFRCKYCMPEEGVPCFAHERIMRYEDILYLCKILLSIGVKRIRLTGGEPFVRRDFVSFLEELRSKVPSLALSVTTNGSLVEPFASALGDMDMDGVNVSLDSLDPRRFKEITRCGDIRPVIRGIRALRRHMEKVKINTVIIRGFNDEELPDLLNFADGEGLLLRLIEFMPLDRGLWSENAFISVDEMCRSLPDRQDWITEEKNISSVSGPAVYVKNFKTGQRLGFIAAVSRHFCDSCNRLRITCDGEVRSCLFSETGESLLDALRKRDEADVARLIRSGAKEKPRCWTDVTAGKNTMSRIGG